MSINKHKALLHFPPPPLFLCVHYPIDYVDNGMKGILPSKCDHSTWHNVLYTLFKRKNILNCSMRRECPSRNALWDFRALRLNPEIHSCWCIPLFKQCHVRCKIEINIFAYNNIHNSMLHIGMVARGKYGRHHANSFPNPICNVYLGQVGHIFVCLLSIS